MSPERWPDVERIYYSALTCDPAGLPAFLKQACGGDEDLRREVESLLAANQRAGEFLNPRGLEGELRQIAAEQAGVRVGKSLGPYRISSQIGAGGMGEVYRARDSRLGRDVAIKVLTQALTPLAGDTGRIQRFEREAQVLASLNHPNIAAIYGIEQGAIVMELVEGENLKGPLAVDTAIHYARQIGAALDAAHERGVVHRDLKPGNIKITEDGVVKVLDFGLAKAFERESGGSNPPGSSGKGLDAALENTRTGVILGTAGYMSPEQARGKAVDPRTDIWAFGVVFYEMLTGRAIFQRETVADTIAAVLGAGIDWSLLPAGTPPKVRRLLQRCLERDPKRRLRNIGDAWYEFDAEETPAVPKRAGAGAAMVAAAALAIGLAAGWWIWHPGPAAPRAVVRWTEEISGDDLDLSADGTRLVYHDHLHARSFLRLLDRFETQQIRGFTGGSATFSPDGQWLATAGAAGLLKLPATGGTPVILSSEPAMSQPSWGTDGTIVYSTRHGLMRISEQGGKPQALTTVDESKGETAHMFPRLLPGSGGVLFTVRTGTAPDNELVAVLDVKARSWRALREKAFNARYVPSGHLLYQRGASLFAVPFDLKRLEVTGGEAPVAEGLAKDPFESRYAVSSTGLLAYFLGESATGGGSTLEWRDRKGRVASTLPTQLWGTVNISPDGKRAAASIWNGGVRRSGADLWIYEYARGTLTRLTFDGASVQGIWTRDGRRIAIGSEASRRTGIWWIPSDFSGRPERLVRGDGSERPQSWSLDGKTLLYAAGTAPRVSLWVVSVPGGQPRLFLQGPGNIVGGRISPDGRWVAYESEESGRREIYVQAFPNLGSKVQVSTEGGSMPRWRSDGRELYYLNSAVTAQGTRRMMVAEIETASGFQASAPRVLFETTPAGEWDAAPDGQRFLVEDVPEAVQNPKATLRMVTNWFEELRRRVPAR